jgi:hypothetical protein
MRPDSSHCGPTSTCTKAIGLLAHGCPVDLAVRILL